MKKFLMMFLCLMMATMSAFAQADKIVGTYKTERNGVNSKIKIFKVGNGYRAQVTWVDNIKKEDGSIRLDDKNPDKAKRSVRADQIVLIDKVTYDKDDKVWEDGKIYDPTNGKTYKVKLDFKDDKTLRVRGYIAMFYESMYWTKIE